MVLSGRLRRPARRGTSLAVEQLEGRQAPAVVRAVGPAAEHALPAPAPPLPGPVTAPTPATTVQIDSAWLAQRGQGPYLLDQPGTTYILQTDVSVPGTAFVVAAPHVTLDLNGHTVRFGDRAYPGVTNGGFEQGTGPLDVPGWDLSKAPAARRAPARLGMWGGWMLSLTKFTAVQQLVSAPVAIPVVGREYVATITPKADAGVQSVELQVIDAVTGQVLAAGDSPNPGRGFGAYVAFTPTSTDPVRLRVVITPQPGATASVDLDYAGLFPGRDYGVVATTTWRGGLPAQLQGLPADYRQAADLTIRNGLIVQGAGRAAGAAAIFAQGLQGLTVDGVDSSVNGPNAMNLYAAYAGGVTVRNSTFRSGVDLVTDRMHIFAAIYLSGLSGSATVTGCTVDDAPMSGIFANSNPAGSTVTITGNIIEQRALVTDGYGVSINALQNFTISHNVIAPVNGRGILIDGWNHGVSQNGEIAFNQVTAYEAPNLEYGFGGLETTALRIRNYLGADRNLFIHDNTFTAITGPGANWAAIAVHISQANQDGQRTGTGDRFVNNVCQALVTTADPTYRAFALVLSDTDPGTGFQIADNVLRTNDTAVALGIHNTLEHTVQDVELVGNQFVQATGVPQRPFTGVLAGMDKTAVGDVRLIDTSYVGATPGPPVFTGPLPKEVGTGFLVDVAVRTMSGFAVAGAQVTLFDGAGTPVYSGVTDSAGDLNDIPVVTTAYRQTTADPGQVVRDDRGPFSLVVTAGKKAVRRSLQLTDDATISVLI